MTWDDVGSPDDGMYPSAKARYCPRSDVSQAPDSLAWLGMAAYDREEADQATYSEAAGRQQMQGSDHDYQVAGGHVGGYDSVVEALERHAGKVQMDCRTPWERATSLCEREAVVVQALRTDAVAPALDSVGAG